MILAHERVLGYIAGGFDMRYNKSKRRKKRIMQKEKTGFNGKRHNIWLTVLLLVLQVCICSGCETIVPYSVERQRMEQDASLYSFADQIADLEHIVCATRYDEDEILLYEELLEDNLLRKKVWLFSYLTGEMQLKNECEVTVKSNYQVTSERFLVYHNNPFVLMDTYADKIYIYTDDLNAYSTIDMKRKETALNVYACDAGFYVMDTKTCKVYFNTLEEFKTTPKDVDYEYLRENSKVVWASDVNMTSCSLEDVSRDGTMLRLYAQSLIDHEFYYFDYDIAKEEYGEVYRLSEEDEKLWQSWDYVYGLKEVTPSAVPRFSYIDYEEGKEYTCKIETENIYSYVRADRMYCRGEEPVQQDMVLFYVVDEKEENIVDVLLWDYKMAETNTLRGMTEKIKSAYPKEIEYEELTEKAEALEEKYGIDIVMGDNVVCEFEAYDYQRVTDEERINYALEQLEKALAAFPDGMCEEMIGDESLGFRVYLCGTFTPKNEENISDAGAFFVYDNDCYNLAVDIMLYNTEANVIHEMTHALDTYFGFLDVLDDLDRDWEACNPEGFAYLNSYFDYEESYEYTYYEVFENIDGIYFCDTYSKTYPGEDRSRVFEYFGASAYESDPVLESAALQKKAGLLLDYCRQYLKCFREDEEYGLKTRIEETKR